MSCRFREPRHNPLAALIGGSRKRASGLGWMDPEALPRHKETTRPVLRPSGPYRAALRPWTKLGWVPVEVQPLVFDLIRMATSTGMTVVEPAGILGRQKETSEGAKSGQN
jgi:hypothetical protein